MTECKKNRLYSLSIAAIKGVLWGSFMILLAWFVLWLGTLLGVNQEEVTEWYRSMQPWLQIWRLALYGFIAGLWLTRVRKLFLQHRGIGVTLRLEILTLVLFLLIELGVNRDVLLLGGS